MEPLLGQGILVILMGIFFGAIPFALTTIFPMNIRFSGISLAHNISMAVFGGTVPLLSSSLIAYTEDLSSPAFILIIAGILSSIGVLCLRSKNAEDIVIAPEIQFMAQSLK